MCKKLLLLFLGIGILSATNKAAAQDVLFSGKTNKLGFLTGDGFQYFTLSYYYHVKFYQLQYYHTLKQKKNFGIEILIQPQYNTTDYRVYDEIEEYFKGYEYGVNAGLLFRKNTDGNRLSYYALISSGPHYTSGTPHRQTSGFIFADNLAVGINLRLYKGLYSDIRFGLRHMSNLGTKIPNGGVNDIVINEGLMVVF